MKNCCKCHEKLTNDEAKYGLHASCFQDWFESTSISEFSDITPRSQSLAPLEHRSLNASFFHGAFKKFSSKLGDHHYILKVVQKEHPELPATEYLCNQIYDSLGVEIPPYFLLRFPDDSLCFATRNFMTKRQNSSLVHIYHFLQSKNDYTCENLVKIIGEQTGRRRDQEKFVFLTLVDSLVGNHDRHGRNIGFIQSAGDLTLSPFYDNPSFIGLDDDSMLGADLQPRGAIYTQTSDEPTTKDYVKEWRRLGYDNIVQKAINAFAQDSIEEIIQKSFITEKRRNALIRLIKKRGDELCKS